MNEGGCASALLVEVGDGVGSLGVGVSMLGFRVFRIALLMGRRQLALGKFGVCPTHWWREMDFELSVPGRKRVIAVGDGELTQDLLHRPPIERKLSDEKSSNRLDTILADGKQRLPSAPCFALPLPMPLVGFAVRFGSGTGETFPRADRVMAAQCPLAACRTGV